MNFKRVTEREYESDCGYFQITKELVSGYQLHANGYAIGDEVETLAKAAALADTARVCRACDGEGRDPRDHNRACNYCHGHGWSLP
jgi:hypothetical protein